MSASVRALARHPSGSGPGALRIATLLMLSFALLASLAITAINVTSAKPPAAVSRVSAEQAKSTGLAVSLRARDDLAPGLVEVVTDAASPAAGLELLTVAPGRARAALVSARSQDPVTLTVADADGSQLIVELPGAVGAAFGPDGTSLAVVDGSGALLSVSLADGSLAPLASGPFLGPLEVGPDGTILLLAVPSVEAPFESRLVRFDPGTQGLTTLSDDTLVYGAQRLDDGALAVAAHERGGGTVVRRVADGVATLLADLGPGAVNVAVASNGRSMAWERDGELFFAEHPAAPPRSLGAGHTPQFAPDARALLVRTVNGGHELVALNGSRTGLAGPAAFVACGRECQP